ncbi:hypothetical protein VTL71DRAFT_7072, partial [Oculimacula yallundae]
AVNAE